MKISHIIRDFAIVFGMTFIGGFAVAMTWSIFNLPNDSQVFALAISNLLLGSLGFLIAGLLTKSERKKHLIHVALAVWLGGLINLAFGYPVTQWLISGFFVMIMMAIGCGVANFMSPQIDSEEAKEEQAEV